MATMLARLLCFFFFCGLSVAQRQQQPLTASKRSPLDGKFRELVEELLEHWHVPGISISVVDGNDTFAEVFLSFTILEPLLSNAGIWHCNFP